MSYIKRHRPCSRGKVNNHEANQEVDISVWRDARTSPTGVNGGGEAEPGSSLILIDGNNLSKRTLPRLFESKDTSKKDFLDLGFLKIT